MPKIENVLVLPKWIETDYGMISKQSPYYVWNEQLIHLIKISGISA